MLSLLALLQGGGVPITDTPEAVGRLVGRIIGVLLVFLLIRALWKRGGRTARSNSPGSVGEGSMGTFPTFRRAPEFFRRRMRLSVLPRVGATVLLVWATSEHGRDFFLLLRWFVFGVAALTAWLAYSGRSIAWAWLAAMLAVLFNPFGELHFTRETWHTIDLVAAVFFALSVFFVSEQPRAPAG